MSLVSSTSTPVTLQLNGKLFKNLTVSELIEHSLQRNEAVLSANGALCSTTGAFTGRSPKDRYIVKDASTAETIDWGPVNQPMEPAQFENLFTRVKNYIQSKELFIFDGFAGADSSYQLPIRVINEFAWHNLFVHQLFIRPTEAELAQHQPEFTVICVPHYLADPATDGTHSSTVIALDLKQKVIIIAGTEYAGEMKKSIFSVMNYLLPMHRVLPMHCSANQSQSGQVALFFGLSGTGKTTLSADPDRILIGDDEHGWAQKGVFNFEGGCYAKCIGLTKEKEPQIWEAIQFGTVLENVILDKRREPVFADDSLTENTRAAYPVEYIPHSAIPGVGGHPSTILFLTADAFGVLPPIAKLSAEQAMYYFLSGYTSKLAGTERGITEPQATFSAGFGSPFLPRPAHVYAELLGKKIAEHQTQVFLVNTGWTGGSYNTGKRLSLKHTRAMVTAALNGQLTNVEYATDEIFRLQIPLTCPEVPAEVLNPRNTWEDKTAYDQTAQMLATRFYENFKQFVNASEAIRNAGPA